MATQATYFPTFDKLVTIYNQRKGQFLLAITVLFAVLPMLNDFRNGKRSSLDLCFINREFETPPPTFIPLRDGLLHDLSVLLMWIAMFTLSLLPNQRPLAFFQLTYASIWFHATYILLAALKSLLLDYNCAGRHKFFPNGISGHYCYFVFVTLTAGRLTRARLGANPRLSKRLGFIIVPCLYLFLVGCLSTLYRTYFHGYHSPRQIFLGIVLGVFSHVTLDYVIFPARGSNSLALEVSVLLANSVTSIALYFRWWPHGEAGPAISVQQLVFHGTLWLFLILTINFLPKPEKKES